MKKFILHVIILHVLFQIWLLFKKVQKIKKRIENCRDFEQNQGFIKIKNPANPQYFFKENIVERRFYERIKQENS